ncbi:M24 family metallopeptidase [Alloiococcus sp. CFN-8]|uniref:M24 family metallopeptidase n=1 Tax=Alloiococcus sp. CFN-8 TaxID=3416081 RepID=UPI003CFB87FC
MGNNEASRFERLKKYMAKEGYDATVVISPENTVYFTGTYVLTQVDIRDRLLITVLPASGEPTVIACLIEKFTVDSESWIKDKRYYVEHKENPIVLLADVLKEKGLANGKIGIELNYLTADYYMELMKRVPGINLSECSHIFGYVKMIKDAVEIQYLTEAANLTREAFEEALTEVHPGCTEKAFADRVKIHMLEKGAETVAFFAMGSGDNCLQAHHIPNDDIMEAGDMMRLDFGCRYKWQYNSDIARTVMLGTPNPKYLDIYKRFSEAYEQIALNMKVGVSAKDIYNICVEKMKEVGLPFNCSHIGHSLGIGVHEYPMLGPSFDCPLEENMVFCLEPVVLAENRMFHHEDLIQITANGPKMLSNNSFKPEVLIIK